MSRAAAVEGHAPGLPRKKGTTQESVPPAHELIKPAKKASGQRSGPSD